MSGERIFEIVDNVTGSVDGEEVAGLGLRFLDGSERFLHNKDDRDLRFWWDRVGKHFRGVVVDMPSDRWPYEGLSPGVVEVEDLVEVTIQ